MRRTSAFLIAASLAVLVLGVAADRDRASSIDPAHPPRFSHVAVIVLENRGYKVLRSPQSTYLRSLARRYGLATRYFGVSHPSLPNYLALTAGATFHVARDCHCRVDRTSLFDQLNAAQIPWKAYFESGLRNTGRVDPFLHYEQATDGSTLGHVASFAQLSQDVQRQRLPRFSWITLGLCHDGHYCSTRFSDRYLARFVPPLLDAVGPHGVVFITWDEGTTNTGVGPGPGGGHVPLIAAGGGALPHSRSRLPANHYALLHTIEDSFGLPPLRKASSAPVAPLNRLLAGPERGTGA
jgi:phosphatidylinositol-3-phosphatase